MRLNLSTVRLDSEVPVSVKCVAVARLVRRGKSRLPFRSLKTLAPSVRRVRMDPKQDQFSQISRNSCTTGTQFQPKSRLNILPGTINPEASVSIPAHAFLLPPPREFLFSSPSAVFPAKHGTYAANQTKTAMDILVENKARNNGRCNGTAALLFSCSSR